MSDTIARELTMGSATLFGQQVRAMQLIFDVGRPLHLYHCADGVQIFE